MSRGYLLALIITAAICLLLFQGMKYSEGFRISAAAASANTALIQSAGPQTQATSDYTGLLNNAQKKLNPVAVASRAIGQGLVTDSLGTFGVLQTAVEGFFGGTSMSVSSPYDVKTTGVGLKDTVAKCEAVTSDSCSAFDDPGFNKDCGICLTPGTNSKGAACNPGGLILLEGDKTLAQSNTSSNFLPNYSPSFNLGKCPAGTFVSNKAECAKLKAQMKCSQSGAIDQSSGCSQCFDDTSYSIVDQDPNAGVIAGPGTIYVVGSGNLQFSEIGQSNSGSINLSSTPYGIKLLGSEGTTVQLILKAIPPATPYDSSIIYNVGDSIIFNTAIYTMREGAGSPGYAPNRPGDLLWTLKGSVQDYVPPPPASIAGYLSGATSPSNTFNFDLYRLVQSDSATGRKPRATGITTIDGIDATTMALGYGKKAMSLQIKNVFTFVDPYTQEASQCSSSPFVTTAASATLLGNDPCYAKGASTPGTFNISCLQNTFLANGCTQDGSGYPSAANSASLMNDSSGKPLGLMQIAQNIYDKAVLTATGINPDGTKASVSAWSAASKWCTGAVINSPCDVASEKYNKTTGPLSPDCLTYLWDNMGQNSVVGTTYSVSTSAFSSLGKGSSGSMEGFTSLPSAATGVATDTYCTRNGMFSPTDAKGKVNQNAVEYWNKFGGMKSVSAEMTRIHGVANGPGPNAQKLREMQQCYGLKFNASQDTVASPFVPLTQKEGFYDAGPTKYTDVGCWRDTGNRSVSGGPKQYGYTIQQCAELAATNADNGGKPFFALQDGDSTTGWCAVGNAGDDYKKYGKVANKCNPTGAGWINHVYTLGEPPPAPVPVAPLCPQTPGCSI